MFTRRQAIFAAVLAPLFSARHSWSRGAIEGLAKTLVADKTICTIAVSTLNAGTIDQTILVSGCDNAHPDHTIFQAASLAKPVVASLALKLVDRKLLGLDEPISTYLPSGYIHRQNLFSLDAAPITDRVSVDLLQRVTARHLLMHCSGLPNWARSGPLGLEFSPGSRWQYSGEGYVLLQRTLEQISGKPLEQLAQEAIFRPLKMFNSSFKLNGSNDRHLVRGAPKQLRFPYEIASSSLYTTSQDYALFLSNVLAEANLLASTLATPVKLPWSWSGLFQSKQLYWGLGWGLEVRDRPVSIWHWGSNPGFRSLVLADLQSKNGVIVLTSSQNGMSAAKSIVDFVIPGGHPEFGLPFVQ